MFSSLSCKSYLTLFYCWLQYLSVHFTLKLHLIFARSISTSVNTVSSTYHNVKPPVYQVSYGWHASTQCFIHLYVHVLKFLTFKVQLCKRVFHWCIYKLFFCLWTNQFNIISYTVNIRWCILFSLLFFWFMHNTLGQSAMEYYKYQFV